MNYVNLYLNYCISMTSMWGQFIQGRGVNEECGKSAVLSVGTNTNVLFLHLRLDD